MGYWKSPIEMELPKPLSREKQLYYFQKMAKGDKEAREILINHNLHLITNIVKKDFNNIDTNLKDELFSVCVIGLIKSIDNFDMNKGIDFSTYAFAYIYGNIKTFFTHYCKFPNTISSETIEIKPEDDIEIKIKDNLIDDSNIILDYEQKDIYRIINIIVENLPPREKEITKHLFGFYDNKPKTQEEIASIIGLSQSQVSRNIIKIINKIKEELYKQEILEDSDLTIKEKYKQKDKNIKQKHTIYTLLKPYQKRQIDDMISSLTEEDKKLITLRYGNDLNNPTINKEWTIEQHNKYYSVLLPKMRILLLNPSHVPRKK